MKKFTIALALVSALFFSCSKEEKVVTEKPAMEESSMAKYTDGVYFAQEDVFGSTGWKYNVTLEVKEGKIVKVVWNGANVNAGKDKVTQSKNGEYGMLEKGGASAPWFEQAALAEAYLLKTQDPTAVNYVDEEGHTDSIAGASIHVVELFSLAESALAAGPNGTGPYKDGSYHAEQAEFEKGYKYFVDVTVISGYVVAVDWDAYSEDGGTNKNQRSEDGEYGMVEKGGAMSPRFEQGAAVESYFLSTQDTTMPDSISGATIGLEPFYELVNEALASAK